MNPLTQNGVSDLQTKVQQPEVAAALERLLDRMDELERTMTQLTTAVEQAPGLVAMAGDVLDESVRTAATHGIDVHERAMASLSLLEQLTDPAVTAQLEALLALAAQAPGLVAMMGDIFDEAYNSLSNQGIDPELVVQRGGQALVQLVDSGMLDPQTLAVMSHLGESLVACKQAPECSLGPVGALRSMGDPDVQRTLGFLMKFAKEFGRALA